MKFISKSANLHVVLKPGIPAQPITGSPAVPTISVRFQDGVVDIKDEELIELMKNHPGYNGDFVVATGEEDDPYAASRTSKEPDHVTTELKFGTPVARTVTGKTKNLSPEVTNLIKEQAAEMARQMLPGMVKSTLEGLISQRDDMKAEESKAKPKGGRPKGTKNKKK